MSKNGIGKSTGWPVVGIARGLVIGVVIWAVIGALAWWVCS